MFFRRYQAMRFYCHTGAAFKAIEDFVDRYENVPMAGMQYNTFAIDRANHAPVIFNTRIYSCILLTNDTDLRWRGRYNEDTDLSLRFLKRGDCTALFYVFLASKTATMRMKGGNTDDLYQDNGRLKMAQSLVEQHPDVTRIIWRYGRWQHHVDYRRFAKNKLIRRAGIEIDPTPNEYGMKLVTLED